MASTSEPIPASSALGQWIEDLFNRIFFQPDDIISANAFNEGVAREFTARINHDRFSRDNFFAAIKQTRLLNALSLQNNRDIQHWDTSDGSGAGCVAQLSHFKLTNKETGVITESSTLVLANIQMVDGKKMLVELTEVAK
ncbi:hypothetical protein EDB81DRAFT_728638 [Dactylonectria macrodidyma]|uniref:Uncharacterized protein n=1 Tax=Dactylonectria macrodidyma TaxID=307937 RepID=A0A9P9DYN0_9HYPO|nr:hypothetical protein EDB81DRAFT_728638 [Dactylonectria macrodidyma]